MKLLDALKQALAIKQSTNHHRTVAGTKRARQMESNFGNKGGIVIPKKDTSK